MGKRVNLFFLFLFVSLLVCNLSFSLAATPDFDDELEQLEEGRETIEQISDEEARSDYLRREGGKILEKKPVIGPMLQFYQKIAPVVDPIFRFTIGMEPTFKWVFFLTLALWITGLIVLYRILHNFSMFSNAVSFMISLGLMIIGGILKIVIGMANAILNVLGTFTIWWVQLIFAVVMILVLVLIASFSKYIEAFILARAKARALAKEKADRETLGKEAEYATQFGEGVRGVVEDVNKPSEGEGIEAPDTGKFEYKPGMRRGGELGRGVGQKRNPGRFVSKKSAENYAKRYGDEAAKKRFGSGDKK